MFNNIKNKINSKLDRLSWKFVGWRLDKMYDRNFGGMHPFQNNIRWRLFVGGVEIGFSAPQPKDDNEMGKVLCDLGKLMQAEKRTINYGKSNDSNL